MMIVNGSDHVPPPQMQRKQELASGRCACGSQCRHIFWLCAQSLLRALDVAQARALANKMGILRRAPDLGASNTRPKGDDVTDVDDEPRERGMRMKRTALGGTVPTGNKRSFNLAG